MVQFNIATCKSLHHKKKIGSWSNHYFPSKILCFFKTPHDETTYAIIHSTKANNHENDNILFERWELEIDIQVQHNGKQKMFPTLNVVNVDCFGYPIILFVEDYTTTELIDNNNKAMVTIVTPFSKGWLDTFMSSYCKWVFLQNMLYSSKG